MIRVPNKILYLNNVTGKRNVINLQIHSVEKGITNRMNILKKGMTYYAALFTCVSYNILLVLSDAKYTSVYPNRIQYKYKQRYLIGYCFSLRVFDISNVQ